MSDVIPPAPTRRPAQTGRVVIGLLLLMPAAMACALTQLWPTLGTISLSFQDSQGFGSDSIFIGLDNYAALFEQGRLFQALGFALLLAISRVIAVAIVPPALGWAIGRFHGGAGALLRGLSAVPALF